MSRIPLMELTPLGCVKSSESIVVAGNIIRHEANSAWAASLFRNKKKIIETRVNSLILKSFTRASIIGFASKYGSCGGKKGKKSPGPTSACAISCCTFLSSPVRHFVERLSKMWLLLIQESRWGLTIRITALCFRLQLAQPQLRKRTPRRQKPQLRLQLQLSHHSGSLFIPSLLFSLCFVSWRQNISSPNVLC